MSPRNLCVVLTLEKQSVFALEIRRLSYQSLEMQVGTDDNEMYVLWLSSAFVCCEFNEFAYSLLFDSSLFASKYSSMY